MIRPGWRLTPLLHGSQHTIEFELLQEAPDYLKLAAISTKPYFLPPQIGLPCRTSFATSPGIALNAVVVVFIFVHRVNRPENKESVIILAAPTKLEGLRN